MSDHTHRSAVHEPDMSAADYWESRYADRLWTGRVNPTMAEVVGDLPAGHALDLGCGEGADAVWLAEQGWTVTAVDISATAIGRGARIAAERGVAERIEWIAHDLTTWRTEEEFDLVTASFFHSTIEMDRTGILRRSAAALRPGGRLLLVSHVFESEDDLPPWAPRRQEGGDGGEGRDGGAGQSGGHRPHELLLGPAEEIAALALDPAAWAVEIEEVRRREATSPDGQQTAWLKDGVVLLRRR